MLRKWVPYLMGTPSRNEHGIAGLLVDPMALNTILLEQLLPQACIQVELLRMNGIVLILSLELLSEELAQLRGIFDLEKVPSSRSGSTIRCRCGVEHDIDSVCHIYMKSS